MGQKLTFYPLGNAETCLLELNNGDKFLFDYAAMYDGSEDDFRYDIQKELSSIGEFKVVMFSHAHEDHTKGASDFFYLNHAERYQSEERAKIAELWVSAAFLLDTDLENNSDAKIIRNEARYRLKEKQGIKVFADPDCLKEWLEEQELIYEEVKHLIVHAGETISDDEWEDELGFFVHAPFSDDSEEVQDKNDPSIVLQMSIYNQGKETNILITGDTTYGVLDKIVDITKANNNESSLKWDIYDVPHHCSYTGLNENAEDEDFRIIPTENVKWILSQAQVKAKMVASCIKITEDTNPPHMIAKRAYEYYTSKDVELLVTMNHIPSNTNRPTPIIFNIDEFGITLKSNSLESVYLQKSAPRAG